MATSIFIPLLLGTKPLVDLLTRINRRKRSLRTNYGFKTSCLSRPIKEHSSYCGLFHQPELSSGELVKETNKKGLQKSNAFGKEYRQSVSRYIWTVWVQIVLSGLRPVGTVKKERKLSSENRCHVSDQVNKNTVTGLTEVGFRRTK